MTVLNHVTMLYILWALLNLGLFLFFLGICWRATKLVRNHIGLVASVVFVFGLLAFAQKSGWKDATGKQTDQARKWTYVSRDSLLGSTLRFTTVNIDKTPLSKIDLLILAGREKTSTKRVPAEATSTKTGFASGHVWIPANITLNPIPTPGIFIYRVNGVLEWTLLGATIYTEPKYYTGYITVKMND